MKVMPVAPTSSARVVKPRNNRRVERNPGFGRTSLAELREMRNGLKKEEGNVSDPRRILQAKVELIRRRADGDRRACLSLLQS